MEKIATENLFLLEFLVDTVAIDQSKCDCDAEGAETCVSFQFLDNGPLDVCEADFTTPKRSFRDPNNENEQIKSGKSCLFSLSPDQAKTATDEFDISVTVMKKMPEGWLPEKIDLGTSLINVANLFNELVASIDSKEPTAKTLKDTFDVINTEGTSIGKISIYLRMSCFGKLIVTQFQMNLNDKSVLFKDKEGKSLYRYKKSKKLSDASGCKPRGGVNMNSTCPTTPCQTSNGQPGGMGGGMGMNMNRQCPLEPCGNGGGMGMGMGQQMTGMGMGQQMTGMGMGQQMPGMGMGQQMPGMGMTQVPCNECGASSPCYMGTGGGMMGGSAGYGQMPGGLTPCIECGNLQYPAPCLPGQQPGMMNNALSLYQPQMGGNEPDGKYQEIGASMGGNSLTIRVHKDMGKIDQNDDSCTCDGGATNNNMPNSNNMTGTHNQFAMRPGVANNPFAFRMGGSGGDGNNNVVVNPPCSVKADGTQFTEFSDPNKETFILRIGKKSEGMDKKNNLELELCTPKGPALKPLPKFETRDTQFDPKDLPAGDGKGKKGKGGKGGKGGKKGGKGGAKKGKKK